MIPINITIDGQSVLDELVSCSFQMDDMSYCWTINLELKSKQFWNACDPNERVGVPRIKLIIGDDVYSFLCEERSTSREKEFSMSVWGRTEGREIDLTPREYALLEFLLRRAGTVVTRSALLEGVWDMNFDSLTNVLEVLINRLRRKIDTPFGSPLIHTVRSVGYVLREGGS